MVQLHSICFKWEVYRLVNKDMYVTKFHRHNDLTLLDVLFWVYIKVKFVELMDM